MKKSGKRTLVIGIMLIIAFAVWTILIQMVDVQQVGLNGTDIGLATFNCWFHKLTGTNMPLYIITDWLGIVPLVICMIFATIGLIQLIKRRSLLQVDYDIIILGIYYILVMLGYFVFEMIPINYRPVFINGHMEASYPSSTTLVVLSVMPTLIFQCNRRIKNAWVKIVINIVSIIFSAFMVIGRLLSGVHWITDIIGSIILSAGLFLIYKAVVLLCAKKEN
ncbi:MAG: phosphatase PAP2 family protein [Eubacteriales bacterium]|jgi:PAP2 family protein|nr:phosphatase PAP2 family protein [Eubacteriales bacterium]MDY5440019.1 phosphatase PAP2 family protein [Eubacteriales bacterium]